MRLALTADQQDLADAVERYLAAEVPITRVRALQATQAGPSLDHATWAECAAAGWLGLGLPESCGGMGLGAVEETQLLQRIGRHLMPGPYRSTILAAHLAIATGDSALAATLVSGERRSGCLVGVTGLDVEPDQLVIAIDGDVVQLIEGHRCEPAEGVDLGVRTSVVTGGTVRAEARDPLLVARARLLAAAEALGVIDAVRDMSARYAVDRVQFGVAIGTFQAVKHRCADMAIASYAADAQIAFAARRLDAGADDAAFQAAAAYLVAVAGLRRSVADNIQNHGAIGFTLEHDAHLYLRRAHTLEHCLGPLRDAQRTVLAPERHEFA